jgi:hypothetical protein
MADATDLLDRIKTGEVEPAEMVEPGGNYVDLALSNDDSVEMFGVHGSMKLTFTKEIYLSDLLKQFNQETTTIVHVLTCRRSITDKVGEPRVTFAGTRKRKNKRRHTKKN